jgi:hypothetical protein
LHFLLILRTNQRGKFVLDYRQQMPALSDYPRSRLLGQQHRHYVTVQFNRIHVWSDQKLFVVYLDHSPQRSNRYFLYFVLLPPEQRQYIRK